MAEILLTAAQAAAVQNRGGALLVSAAAGSGKTKVLVDRLMDRICDPAAPRNINDFLIITYTKAAASELRGKISAELGRRLAGTPGDRHLQRQQSLVYLTQISTVHAFCADLLRTYAHLRDLPADFRVAEELECAQLRQRCLETVLEDAYQAAAQFPALEAVTDILGSGRDDRGAAAAVEALYHAAQCHPDPEAWMDACARTLDMAQYAGCAETPWGRELLARFRDFLEAQQALLAAALEDMAELPPLEKAYRPAFQETLEHLELLASLREWDAVSETLALPHKRLQPARGFEDKVLLERFKGVRSRCLDGLKEWRGVFYGGDGETMDDLRGTAEALLGALELARRLQKAYAAEKRRRRMLDFGDLEHEAIRLLTDRAARRPTAAAREVAARYEEVLVDEYQDSNQVQECIFAAIAREGRNRFLVGDVKQSIYRFRLADPGIFLEKYKRYAPAAEAGEGVPRKLLLSENFRSRPEILAAVNDVFCAVMSEAVGDLAYGPDEMLRPGLSFAPAAGPVVELHCIETAAPEGASAGKTQTEAQFVAARVAQLLAGGRIEEQEGSRPVRPEDIVILLRSVSSAAPAYAAALRVRGIPCRSDRGESVLDSREVETLISLLQVIDNPRRDIPLVSALESPLYGFTAQELAEIRARSRGGSFYDALCAAAPERPHVQDFLTQLEDLRAQARWLPLHRLVRLVYDRTRAEAIFGAMEGGAQRRANLRTFFTFAAGYPAGGAAALMQLLSDVEARRAQGTALPPENTAAGGAVQLMSIHKSKGLEFPVVILADLSRRFNAEDLRRGVLTHPQLMAAASMLDREQGVRFPTIGRKAISMRLQQESLSEELRVLYVAMTRAKNRLIMTYCSKFVRTELENLAAEAALPAPPSLSARARCPGAWVLMAALCRSEAGALHEAGARPRACAVSEYPWDIRFHSGGTQATAPDVSAAAEEAAVPPPLPDLADLRRRLDYQYPHLGASRVPSKVTATQMKGREVDLEASEDAAAMLPPPAKPLRRPSFVTAKTALTPAEKGTANHLFLQFARYEDCGSEAGLDRELERLLLEEFLTSEQVRAVERQAMLRLFASPLGQRILGCPQVVREFKFSILVDGSFYNPAMAGEQLMLQGVVDCLLVEDDGLTVIDFKTDRVRPGGEDTRAGRYAGQLQAYAMALSRIYGLPVRRRCLYFLTTGRVVEVKAD
ncbi:MAG: helicase-exonuclease AddAB subunit AddA [Oscillospiraceae bacterium]|nr:helicase-exonuclease AddAB subunit AddA [Oscillospiraceae bacterium]